GVAYQHLGKLDSALSYLDQSVELFADGHSLSTIKNNPALIANIDGSKFARSYFDIGQVLLQKYRTSAAKVNLMDSVANAFQAGLEIERLNRSQIMAVGSKFTRAKNIYPLYEAAISSNLDLAALKNDPQYLQSALIAAEQAKGAIVLEERSKALAKQQSELPVAMLKRDQQIRRDLVFYESKVYQEEARKENADQDKIARFRMEVFDLKQQLHDWEAYVREKYPAYLRKQNRKSAMDPANVQKALLAEDELMVEYFVGKEELYSFILSKDSMVVYRENVAAKLNHLVKAYYRAVNDYDFIHDSTAQNFQAFTSSASELYEILLSAPLRDFPNTKKLTIIPHAALNRIPFEALLTESVDESKVNFGALPYLLKSYEVRYSPSAVQLEETHRSARAPGNGRCLSMAPSYIQTAVAQNRGVRQSAGHL
ncbi:MAG: CHAT domain-containing protein, partial [Bacteroidota bacterium]